MEGPSFSSTPDLPGYINNALGGWLYENGILSTREENEFDYFF